MTKTSWEETLKDFAEANFLQSPEYGRMNELLGAKVITRDFRGKDGKNGRALMIVRKAKRGKYLEIPCGPLIDWTDDKLTEKVLKEIQKIAKKEGCAFVRMRPQIKNSPAELAKLEGLGLKKSPMHLAAEHTVIIDLKQTEDEMLSKMRRQTRYEVRKAKKQEIRVEKGNSEELFREFHAVQSETAKRQKFIPPNIKTLLAEREAFGDKAEIYVAKTKEGEKIAYGLIIKDGQEGDYYEAASTPLNRKLPGAYALIWQAMKDLKEEGFLRFNLWGIAPAGQPEHRYAKVTTFKTGFGGEVVEFVPAHDLIISQPRYLFNLIVETIRRKWRHL